MDTATEFRKHAVDCNRMAKVSKDPETKGVWRRMAERWLLCAKLAEEDEQSLAWISTERNWANTAE
jgi:PerC transcriptional activator